MSDHELTPRPDTRLADVHGEGTPPLPHGEAARPPLPEYADPGEEGSGFDPRRYLHALLRRKWWILSATVIGAVGAAGAWRVGEVEYTAVGSLWLENRVPDRGTGDVTPIRASGLLEASAWIELLRSFTVLDSVVVNQRLYIRAPREYEHAFASLRLSDSFRPGAYRFRVEPDGRSFLLSTSEGALIQRGAVGEPVGADIGIEWLPPAGALPPGKDVEFRIVHPRQAGVELAMRLGTRIDQQGNFLQLTLTGTDPEHVAEVLNALMERHVSVAADLKSARLNEMVDILEEQLLYAENELADAERDLESFRVNTITLPTDQATPIAPGLEQTRDPVFGNYFDMQVQLEALRGDRERLQQVVDGFGTAPVRIEALEAIPAAQQSSELRALLSELVEARTELRALRERYSDEFGPVQDLIRRIDTLEQEAIPRVTRGILLQLTVRENQMQALVDSASTELAEIPPRTIEEGRRTRRVQITGNLYNELRSRVETARLAAASSIPDVRILDRAAVPQVPTDDGRVRLAGLIFLFCVGGTVGGVLALDVLFDRRVRYASDVPREFGLEILGSIPRIQMARKGRGATNSAQALEAFRELRIHTGFAYGSAGPITIAITSPSAGEGKSLISSNLAVAFAEVGKRTLLIDGDTRRGDAHRLLGRQRVPGLVDYLRDRSGQDIIQETDIRNLDFVGSGSRGASTPELLASARLAHFMGTLKRSYEVIIVDCPPLAAGGDALILGSLVGNMEVVLRTGSTDKQLTQAKLEQVQRLPIRILGAILNDVDPTQTYDAYYYSTYLPDYQPIADGEDDEGVRLLSRGPS